MPEARHCCPCCGDETTEDLAFHKNAIAIFRCRACGVGRAEVAGFIPARYYTQSYFSGGHSDGYADYLGSEAILRREFVKTANLICSHGVTRGKLLEIGCAYGFFLQEARRNFDVFGIEISKAAVDYCHKSGLPQVREGVVTEAALEKIGMVDVIALFDVVEHLPDPAATLTLLRRHLRPGGLIVLTTGDWGSPLARIMGANWRLMTPPQHLWFFTLGSLARLGERLNLHLAEAGRPGKNVPLSLILFQLARMLGLHRSPRLPFGGSLAVPVNLRDSMRLVFRAKSDVLGPDRKLPGSGLPPLAGKNSQVVRQERSQ